MDYKLYTSEMDFRKSFISEMNSRVELYKTMSPEDIELMKNKIFEYCNIDRMIEKGYYPKFYLGHYGSISNYTDLKYLFDLFLPEKKQKKIQLY